MGERTNILVFVFLFVLCIQSVYSEWIPKLDEVTTQQWNSLLKNFDIEKSYKTCNKIEVDKRSKFIPIYKNKPATYVITGNGDGHVDIKFKDSNYIFDQEININNKQYMIIPPYQPVEWMWLRFGGDIKICAFEDSQTTPTNTEKVSGCACTEAIEAAETFYSAKFPHTIRKPDHQFFLTADTTPETDDVTICTIVTVDRLLRVSQMSDFWRGPISVAVFIQDMGDVSTVMDWYLTNNSLRRHVDMHLVYDDKLVAFNLPDRAFPVNILRNVAIRYARTSNVFYIEGDFIPSPDLHSSLEPVRKRLAAGEKTVFIIAPFSTDKYDFDMTKFPKDKQSLEKMVNGANSPIKDLSYYNSHAAFDFKKWFKSTDSYSQGFLGGYEPYYIGAKDYPLFEEIFIGCGADKVSHPTELNAAGYTFNVHPTGFIVHVDSTGMGSAWCRNWAGHERTTMKWEAFQLKTSNIYRSNAQGSFDSRVPWWDLAPVAVTKAKLGAGKKEEKESEVCEAPPRGEDKVCPPCNSPAEGPDSTNWEDMYNTATQDLSTTRLKTKKLEDDVSKRQLQLQNLENSVKTLRLENEKLQENSKFVVNLCIGIIVVMIVVVGVGLCVLPRGKRVWVLPTWKATHHNL